MSLDAIARRLRRRAHRREYRRMVRRWWDEGGDYKFRFDYDLKRDSLVMDLGGYEGQWASDIYSRYRCRILIFEPVSSFANRIRERFQHNGDLEVLQYGLGGESRTETIYVHGAGSSTFRKRADAEQIRIVDAKTWFDENDVDSVQLMKINIEGAEFELLERLIGTGLVERIRDIQVQFHNVAADSTTRMESIQQALRRTHRPTYQFKFVWENWTRKANDAG